MFTKRGCERWYPLLGGAIIAVAFFITFPDFPVPPDSAPSLFSAMVSLSAIAVGFLATAKAILFSIDQRQIITQLRAIGQYDRLVDYLLAAIRWSFGLAVASAFCFVVDLKTPAAWHHYALTAWLFVLSTAGFSCYRVIHIFGKLLRSPSAPVR